MESFEGSDTFFVDHVLEAVDSMTGSKQPKVLLFDIGGVCVSDPLISSVLALVGGLGIATAWR